MGRTYTLRRQIDLITLSPRIPTMQQVRKGKRSVFSKLRDTQQVRFLWGGVYNSGGSLQLLHVNPTHTHINRDPSLKIAGAQGPKGQRGQVQVQARGPQAPPYVKARQLAPPSGRMRGAVMLLIVCRCGVESMNERYWHKSTPGSRRRLACSVATCVNQLGN